MGAQVCLVFVKISFGSELTELNCPTLVLQNQPRAHAPAHKNTTKALVSTLV